MKFKDVKMTARFGKRYGKKKEEKRKNVMLAKLGGKKETTFQSARGCGGRTLFYATCAPPISRSAFTSTAAWRFSTRKATPSESQN